MVGENVLEDAGVPVGSLNGKNKVVGSMREDPLEDRSDSRSSEDPETQPPDNLSVVFELADKIYSVPLRTLLYVDDAVLSGGHYEMLDQNLNFISTWRYTIYEALLEAERELKDFKGEWDVKWADAREEAYNYLVAKVGVYTTQKPALKYIGLQITREQVWDRVLVKRADEWREYTEGLLTRETLVKRLRELHDNLIQRVTILKQLTERLYYSNVRARTE